MIDDEELDESIVLSEKFPYLDVDILKEALASEEEEDDLVEKSDIKPILRKDATNPLSPSPKPKGNTLGKTIFPSKSKAPISLFIASAELTINNKSDE